MRIYVYVMHIYLGETGRNASLRSDEHGDVNKMDDSSQHILNNFNHYFTWSIIRTAPKNQKKGEMIKGFFITLHKPTLNNQVE